MPKTEKLNIKHYQGNATPISNTSIHSNFMTDNQHDKPKLENVYRTKSRRILKKPK